MLVIAWTIVGLIALFIICSCIKSCVRTAAVEHFKNVPIRTPTLITYKDKIIQSLFDGDVEKFFKYKGTTFWYYKDSKNYFELYRFSIANVKNKIAQTHNKLRRVHPGITNFLYQ